MPSPSCYPPACFFHDAFRNGALPMMTPPRCRLLDASCLMPLLAPPHAYLFSSLTFTIPPPDPTRFRETKQASAFLFMLENNEPSEQGSHRSRDKRILVAARKPALQERILEVCKPASLVASGADGAKVSTTRHGGHAITSRRNADAFSGKPAS